MESTADGNRLARGCATLVVAGEQRGAWLGCVVGAVALGVVERGDVHSARAGGRCGQGGGGVAAVLHADHASGDAVADEIQRDVGVGDGDDLVNRVGFAAAEVVSQVALDGFLAGSALQFIRQGVTNVHFFSVAVGVGFAVLVHNAVGPGGSLGDDHQGIVAGIVALIFYQELADAIEIEGDFGDEAAGGSDVRSVERGEAGIAPENAEDADAFVRAESGALAIDGIFRAGDGGGKTDAVFGAVDVVVHGFGDADYGKTFAGKDGGEAERVVAADGDQAVNAEALEIFEDDGSEVVKFAIEGKFFELVGGDVRGNFVGGDFAGIGAGSVQSGAAPAVNGASIFAGELAIEAVVAGVGGIHVGETFPAFANAGDGVTHFSGAVDHGFDYGVQAGDVATAG